MRAAAALLLFACAPALSRWDNREADDSVPIAEGDGLFHRVGKGETPYRIAQAYKIPVEDLLGVNDITDARRIRTGDYLYVPGAKSVAVVPIEPPPKPAEEKIVVEKLEAQAGKLSWPVDGIVTSKFGVRGATRRHDGIDIAAPEGSIVVAADKGVVLYAGDEQRGYGNLIIVKHDGGLITLYAHNKQNLVREGQHVQRGQHIAHVGKTGRAEAPHVHFEVRQLDKPKNPLLFLP